MSLPVSTATRSALEQRIEELSAVVDSMNKEIKSPFDEKVQDALNLIADMISLMLADE